MRLWDYIKSFPKNRTLQVDIVTLFTSLTAITSAISITYTYSRNYSSILNFSRSTIAETCSVVYEKTSTLISNCEKIPISIDGIVNDKQDIYKLDSKLMNYIHSVLKIEKEITGVFLALNDGSFLSIDNIAVTHQETFITNPLQPLPETALYTLEYINKSSPPYAHLYIYLDSQFVEVAKEQVQGIDYDPTQRPWFIGAKQNKKVFWTDVYTFYPRNDAGISVSYGIYNDKNERIGVSGVDLSLVSISNFLQKQKISANGEALIFDKKSNQVIMPPLENRGKTPESAIKKAVLLYQQNQLPDTTFEDLNITYLVGYRDFPLSTEQGWIIVALAPIKDFFDTLLTTQKNVVLISLSILSISIFIIYFLSKRISKPIEILAHEIDKIKNLELSSNTHIQSNIREIMILDQSIAAMRTAIGSFSRYVPKEIVRQLIREGEGIHLGGEKKDITILFTDISGFTPISEKMEADVLMPLLSTYFNPLSKIIIGLHGTIDKYIGDSIMAFWGAPKDLHSNWTLACEAALRCHAHLKEFNEQKANNQEPLFLTKFGLDFGTTIVGNIGTSERINYTAIGDAVNTASRLQALNNTYGTSILVTQNLFEHIKYSFLLRPIDRATMKGKTAKIMIYELMGKFEADTSIEPSSTALELAGMFTKAFEAYDASDFSHAKVLFANILQKFPDDGPSKYYLEKLKSLS